MSHRFRYLPVIALALCSTLFFACSETEGPADTGADIGIGPDLPVQFDVEPVEDTALAEVTPDVVEDTAEPPQDTEPAGPDIPETDIKPVFGNCSEPGGSRNIYDLQDPQCPDHISPQPIHPSGVEVALKAVVVSAVFGDTIFVQEEAGGPYSGISVFTHGMPLDDLSVGTRIDLIGTYSEFYECSQIYAESWEVISQGNPPAAFVAESPYHLSTNGPLAEMFEGVLVRVTAVETEHTIPDCPHDFGEFMVTGDLRIDDLGFKWEARLGDVFTSITGPLHYTFGNFKILPREESDLVWTAKGNENSISKCIAGECQAPESEKGSQVIVINEVMADPAGSDYGQEWFELYNTTDSPVDISDWEIRDCADQKLPLVGLNLVVPAKGYLVVGMNGDINTNGGVDVGFSYGQGFYLPNTLGSILLYDGSGPQAKLVDQIRYSRFDPWKAFKGSRSLERISPTNDGTSPDSWKAGKTPYGSGANQGTPGSKNAASN